MIAAMLRGSPVDFTGSTISGAEISKAIREAVDDNTAASALSISNAKIDGDLSLDLVAEGSRPIRLQLLRCNVAGSLRSRGGHWQALLIAHSKLHSVDIARAEIAGDVLIEVTHCAGLFAATGCRVGGVLSLHDSEFADPSGQWAIDLSDAHIGGDLDARGLTSKGEFRARHVQIGAALRLDGAVLDDSDCTPSRALDLGSSIIGGEARFCQGERPFEAKGTIVLFGAVLGDLTMRGAKVDGRGEAAIVAEQAQMAGTVDLSGLPGEGGALFEARGALRFGVSHITRQVQIMQALIEAPDQAVIFHGATIGGDVLIGYEQCRTVVNGDLVLDAATIGGSVRCEHLELVGKTRFGLRHAKVLQEVALHDLASGGPVILDNCAAERITVQNLKIVRVGRPARTPDMPEDYADAEDALLELNHAKIEGDLRLERIHLEGGDLRMAEARVGASVQMLMIQVVPHAKVAFLGQMMTIGGGFMIGGSSNYPCVFAGEVQLLNAQLGRGLTLLDVQIGTEERDAVLMLGGIVADTLHLRHVDVFGTTNASSCRVEGDLAFESSRFLCAGKTAIDLRRARVGGKLQFATASSSEPISWELHGGLIASGATVAILGWHRIRLRKNSILDLSSIAVQRHIECDCLEAEQPARIDLGGTETPLLNDKVDETTDGWGAGKVGLGLDNFRYGRLAQPSGGHGDDPKAIRRWRRTWLERRYDDRSARPGRQLAQVLQDQGLFEASRLTLLDAFASEGRNRDTAASRGLSWLFGLTFGYGMSGWRAASTIVALWLLGASGLTLLEDRRDLMAGSSATGTAACPQVFDPLLASADLMIPVLDFGYDKMCVVKSPAPGDVPFGPIVRGWRMFGRLSLERAAVALFQVLGWIALSLAIATWSGLFRRGGRQ